MMISYVKTVLNIPDCYYPTIIELNNKYYLIYRTYVEHDKSTSLTIDLEITKIITSDKYDYFDLNNSELFMDNLKGKSASVNHNFALFKFNNKLIGVGGVRHYQYINKDDALFQNCTNRIPTYVGISLTTGEKLSDIKSNKRFKPIIRKHLPTPFKISVFDSNISMIYFKNKYMMYVRHNVDFGLRSIQIYQSDSYTKWESKSKVIKFNQTEYNNTIYNSSIFTANNVVYGIFAVYQSDNQASEKDVHNFIKYHPTNYKLLIGKSHNGFDFDVVYLDGFENRLPVIGCIDHLTDNGEFYIYLYNIVEKSIELYKLNIELI